MRLVVEMCSASGLILKEPRVPSARVGQDGARTDCAIVRLNYNSSSISLYFLVPSAFFLLYSTSSGCGISYFVVL